MRIVKEDIDDFIKTELRLSYNMFLGSSKLKAFERIYFFDYLYKTKAID